MVYETVTLTDKYSSPTLSCYAVTEESDAKYHQPVRDAILVIPGGGYRIHSHRECEVMAMPFVGEGFNAFVLRYGLCDKAKFPNPVIEVSLAIKHIRDNAERYNINPERIFVLGFSAGGHLAASIGSLWCDEEVYRAAGIEYGENRPTGVILSYPVISGDPEIWHRGSFCYLAEGKNDQGVDPAREICEKYSIEKRVTENTVPTFIWSTVTDQLVPVENSLRMACALQAHKIPYELHIYPTGLHGLALATDVTAGGTESRKNAAAAGWFDEAIRWMRNLPSRPSSEE